MSKVDHDWGAGPDAALLSRSKKTVERSLRTLRDTGDPVHGPSPPNFGSQAGPKKRVTAPA